MTARTQRNKLRWLLALLVVAPSGRQLGMPLLPGSTFTDVLGPGIILFTVLGVAPCLLLLGQRARR